MSEDRTRPVDVGDRLPVGSVVTVDGQTVLLRPSARMATILVLAHPLDCDGCRAYLASLDDAAAGLDRWGARALAVVPDDGDGGRLGYPVVHDDSGLRGRFGVAADDVAVVVADRHGEVWAAYRDSGHEDLPAVDDLEQDVRFIAIQCPECEVPDTAALGEWAASGA